MYNTILDVGAVGLVSSMGCNCAMLTLKLEHNRVGEGQMGVLRDRLTRNANQLFATRIGDNVPLVGPRDRVSFGPLLSVALPNAGIGPESAAAVAAPLAENTYLHTLDFCNKPGDSHHLNRAGETGAAALAEALKVNDHLTYLGLADNMVRDGGAGALADALLFNNGLITLRLEDCGIGNIGCSALAKALWQNGTLEALYLVGNHFDDEGAADLAEMLDHNMVLKVLDIQQTPVSRPVRRMIVDRASRNKVGAAVCNDAVSARVCEVNAAHSLPPERSQLRVLT
jgi:hypothetical protein